MWIHRRRPYTSRRARRRASNSICRYRRRLLRFQLRGTQPGAQLFLDRDYVSTAGPEGNASVPGVKPGDHTIELKRDGFQPKRFVRTFKAGETVTLSGPDVALEKVVAESKPAPDASG